MMVALRYCSEGADYKFIILLRYFRKISKEAVKHSPYETGGIFIGCYDKTLHTAKVTQLLFNQQNKGSVAKFYRNGNTLTKLLERIWKTSREKEYYIGEWHSHPNSSPSPSVIDVDNMINIAKTQREQCRTPILCVLGYEMEDYKRDIVLFVYPNGKNAVKLYFSREIK